jgi:hypothetical protein
MTRKFGEEILRNVEYSGVLRGGCQGRFRCLDLLLVSTHWKVELVAAAGC